MNITNTNNQLLQLSSAELIEEAILNGEGKFSNTGALVCYTGKFTGRSPLDKFIVKDSTTTNTVDWGTVNIPITNEHFENLYCKMQSYLTNKKSYVRNMYACATPKYRIPISVVNTLAWHNLFCLNLFIQPTDDELKTFEPSFSIICIPEFEADPAQDGTRKSNFTIINLTKRVVLIGGTHYAGELKKCIFTFLNYSLPLNHNVLPMHCSATVGKNNDTAIFFGLSGTGKTTLSADTNRSLVGDDQHGWSDDSIFNFEGGCYAKTINLSQENEPHIYEAIRFGALLENVVIDPHTRVVDYNDDTITENTRAAYPISFIANAKHPSIANTPSNIFFLTCDAYGVLPPISRLNKEQAMYHFLSGYTAKVAGTESGIKEPTPTFSACFGAVFLPLHPGVYATLLGKKLESKNISVWLINTGWIGGKYGVGARIDLPKTRAIINATLAGKLDDVEYVQHEVFGISIPKTCHGVPCEILNPKTSWKDTAEYDKQSKELALAFVKNFSRYENKVEATVLKGGPRV